MRVTIFMMVVGVCLCIDQIPYACSDAQITTYNYTGEQIYFSYNASSSDGTYLFNANDTFNWKVPTSSTSWTLTTGADNTSEDSTLFTINYSLETKNDDGCSQISSGYPEETSSSGGMTYSIDYVSDTQVNIYVGSPSDTIQVTFEWNVDQTNKTYSEIAGEYLAAKLANQVTSEYNMKINQGSSDVTSANSSGSFNASEQQLMLTLNFTV